MAENRKQKASSISAIFFDLDNTLIQTRKADKLACEKLVGILNEKFDVPLDVARQATQSFLRNFRLCPDNPEVNIDDWRQLLWSKALGVEYSDIIEQVYCHWLYLRYSHLAIPPDVAALLRKLRESYVLGLITNGPSCAQWEKVNRLGLEKYFDCILVSGDLPWEKPDKHIFMKACQYLGVEPSQCIMVGDKLETDIQGGKEAALGCTVWVLPDSPIPEIIGEDLKPDFVLNNVTDLLRIFPPSSKRFVSSLHKVHNYLVPSFPDLEDSCSNSSDGS